MKKAFMILSGCCLFMCCRQPNKEIVQRIAGADSMALSFFKGDGTMDTVVSVKIVRDRRQIDELAALVGEQKTEKAEQCGYDGSLHFFKMNQVIQAIDFGMSQEGCMYFSFAQRGKTEATVLSGKAKELISSFRK